MSTLKPLTPEQEHQRQQFVDNLILKMGPLGMHLSPTDFMRAITAVTAKRDEILQLITGDFK